jgi:LysM repeat protein
MSSIRPLITITILVVVGAYLYVKINEGPARPPADSSAAWNDPAEDVPPLIATGDVANAGESSAPPWSATVTPEAALPALPAGGEQLAAVDTVAQPAMPAIPEMPQLPTVSQPPATELNTTPLSTELPANIPTARYPDQAAVDGAASSTVLEQPETPPASAAAGGSEVTNPPEATVSPPLTSQPATVTSAPSESTAPPLATGDNPLRQSIPPVDGGDRYGAAPAPNPASLSAAPSPAEASFIESWPAIQAALDRGELAGAHQLLSRWYDDPSLTPIDAEKVETLLSQLAGTVVYSTEHQLAPAYVVKPGETLETIAKQYDVPWQLLAKINGISGPNQVRAGQELKVVRGPFSAVVDLARNQLTLMVDGRFAGKFPVSVAPGQTISDGQWVVDQKVVAPGAAPITVTQFVSGARAIVLRGEAQASGGAAATASTLTITSGSPEPVAASAGTTLHVSAKDAEELSDILSIGSRVVTRR